MYIYGNLYAYVYTYVNYLRETEDRKRDAQDHPVQPPAEHTVTHCRLFGAMSSHVLSISKENIQYFNQNQNKILHWLLAKNVPNTFFIYTVSIIYSLLVKKQTKKIEIKLNTLWQIDEGNRLFNVLLKFRGSKACSSETKMPLDLL